jgi:hypothetical protein
MRNPLLTIIQVRDINQDNNDKPYPRFELEIFCEQTTDGDAEEMVLSDALLKDAKPKQRFVYASVVTKG